jgi:predicted amidophosphoribosyltransferase
MLGAWIAFPVPLYAEYALCLKCGRQIPLKVNYCGFCGVLLRPDRLLKICPKCWSKIQASAKFCPECGKKQPLPLPK